jgi:hypothetical protein
MHGGHDFEILECHNYDFLLIISFKIISSCAGYTITTKLLILNKLDCVRNKIQPEIIQTRKFKYKKIDHNNSNNDIDSCDDNNSDNYIF